MSDEFDKWADANLGTFWKHSGTAGLFRAAFAAGQQSKQARIEEMERALVDQARLYAGMTAPEDRARADAAEARVRELEEEQEGWVDELKRGAAAADAFEADRADALGQVAALRQALDRIMRDYFDDSRISPRLEAECQRALSDTRPKP